MAVKAGSLPLEWSPVRLGWKWMVMANSLAYYGTTKITVLKALQYRSWCQCYVTVLQIDRTNKLERLPLAKPFQPSLTFGRSLPKWELLSGTSL